MIASHLFACNPPVTKLQWQTSQCTVQYQECVLFVAPYFGAMDLCTSWSQTNLEKGFPSGFLSVGNCVSILESSNWTLQRFLRPSDKNFVPLWILQLISDYFGHPQGLCWFLFYFWYILKLWTVYNTWEILEPWLCRSPRLMSVALCTIYTFACVYWNMGLNWVGRYPGEPKMWEFNQTGNSLGVISKSSSQEAISLRSSRKHILNLLTVVMFVSFVYIKLWTGIGPKSWPRDMILGGRAYTSCRGYSNQPCHSLFLSNNTPRRCIHIEVCRIKRYQVLFGEYFFDFLFKQCPQLKRKYTTPIFRLDISSNYQSHPTLLAIDISGHIIWSKPHFGSSSRRLRPVADSPGLSGLTRCFRLPALWSRCLRLLPLLLGHSRRQWRTSLTTKRTHQKHPESWSLGEDCDEGLGFNPTPIPWPRKQTRLVCALPNPNLQDDLLLHDADAAVGALDASAGQLLPVGHWHGPLWAGHREGVHLSRRHAWLKAWNSYVDRLHRPLQVRLNSSDQTPSLWILMKAKISKPRIQMRFPDQTPLVEQPTLRLASVFSSPHPRCNTLVRSRFCK